jgi:hypothetical protein
MKIPTNLNGYKLFSALGIFILGLEFLAIVLTLFSIFYWPILATYLLAGIFVLAALLSHNHKNINLLQFFTVSLISLFAIIIFSLKAEPTVFSGRDQGSFSEAAVRLTQNHKLAFETPASREFFKIYGTGSALNFPGFNYTTDGKLITHFSLGYIAWLATFYSLFGLSGFLVANGILFFLFLLSFFALIKFHSTLRSAWLGILLALSTFVFSWFFKFTLSENLALGFIWFGSLELSLFLKYRNQLFLLSALSAFLLLAFTRIEAWALLAMLGSLLFIFQRKEKNLFSQIEKRKLFWLLGIFSLSYLATLKVNSQFYLSSLKGLLNSFSEKENGFGIFSALAYLAKIFHYYGLLIFLVLGLLGVIYFIYKKKYSLLAPAFLLLPIYFYLVHPGISPDHPWMLRRFFFAIIPLGIFYTTLLVNRLFSKKLYFFSLATIFILANLLFSSRYITFSENAGLLRQTKTLSENFLGTDLVLVDRLASGDGWSMISAPMSFLYGKQAVYFFNPIDLSKLNLKKFTNVYLIIPDENLAFYAKFGLAEKLIPQKDYQLERKYLLVPDLNKTTDFFQLLPQKFQSTTKGEIYLLRQ